MIKACYLKGKRTLDPIDQQSEIDGEPDTKESPPFWKRGMTLMIIQ